jgi:hypothetical protein
VVLVVLYRKPPEYFRPPGSDTRTVARFVIRITHLLIGKATLTLAEFDTRFRAFLLDVYHRRENAETKKPAIKQCETNGFLRRMPDSLEQLDLLLIQVAKARHRP